MRHTDPERSIVVGRPVALLNRNGREVFIVERAPLDRIVITQLDPPVRVLNCFAHIFSSAVSAENEESAQRFSVFRHGLPRHIAKESCATAHAKGGHHLVAWIGGKLSPA